VRKLFLLFLAGAAAFAQRPARPGAAQPNNTASGTARVAGRVVKNTGEVLRRATIDLLGPQRYTVPADANGAFAIAGVVPGRYTLIARHVGYSSQKYGAPGLLALHCPEMDSAGTLRQHNNFGFDIVANYRSCIEHAPGVLLALAAGQEMRNLVLMLQQHSVISGKVLDQDGEPVIGTVSADQLVYQNGVRTLQTADSTMSEADGGFMLDDLAPGRYYLRATAVPGAVAMGGGIALYGDSPGPHNDAPTYYPSESDVSKATPVEAKPGEESAGATIVMRKTGVFTVRGAVTAPPGVPLTNLYVVLGLKDSPSMYFGSPRSTPLGPDGSFEIRNVQPGTYLTYPLRPTPQTMIEQREVEVSGDVEGLNLQVLTGVAVSGTVKVDGPKPESWPSVTLAAPGRTDNSGSITTRPEMFDADGNFSFPPAMSVAPGPYEIRVDPLPGMYLKSIRYGDNDAMAGPVDIAAGTPASLEITYSANIAAIAGKVTSANNEPVAGALVLAWPGKPGAGGVHSAASDQNGNFTIADLGPGDYSVVACGDLDPGLASSPAFLARFQAEAVAASLAEGGRAAANLKLIPPERVAAEAGRLP